MITPGVATLFLPILLQIVHNGHVHHVGIDSGGLYAFVPQQFLHGCGVYPVVYQQGSVGMAGGVERDALR